MIKSDKGGKSPATQLAEKAHADHVGIGLVNMVFKYSDEIKDGRTNYDVLASTAEELGELATEVAIEQGFKPRAPSVDGVVGEAIDLIICALDMIHIHDPKVTRKQIEDIAKAKCLKWRKSKGK